MKKTLSAIFLLLSLFVFLFPAAAFAEDIHPDAAAPANTEESLPATEDENKTVEEAEAEEEPVPPEQTPESLAAAAAFAQQIESDGPLNGVTTDGPINEKRESIPASLTISAGESFYAYEGAVVYNNGGTVYNNLATVYNNGGVVFLNGGKVYNNAGTVYANSGLVYNNGGTVYNNEAEVIEATAQEGFPAGQVLGYYELKLGGYYEPYVIMSGVTTEPGAERMIVSEDSICRFTPKAGYDIIAAETSSGSLIWDADGSVILSGIDADLTLVLDVQATAEEAQTSD